MSNLGYVRGMTPEQHEQWHEDMTKAVKELTGKGFNLRQIAEETGAAYSTVARFRRDIFGPTTKDRISLKLHSVEARTGHKFADIVEAMRRKGMGQKAAAQKLRMSSTHLAQICDQIGVQRLGRGVVNQRVPTEAIEAAKEANQKPLTLGGETLTREEWVVKLGITYAQLVWRIKNWPEENILSGDKPPRTKTHD